MMFGIGFAGFSKKQATFLVSKAFSQIPTKSVKSVYFEKQILHKLQVRSHKPKCVALDRLDFDDNFYCLK